MKSLFTRSKKHERGGASSVKQHNTMTPSASPLPDFRDEGRIWTAPQQQLSAYTYTAWVNSQLQKKPGTQLVEDLSADMRDGVIFADIIEIVSQEQIPGIIRKPTTDEERRVNVDQVLQFMTQNRIKMHRISCKDIVDGNLKAVMRLILALAAHYKPANIRHYATSSTSGGGGAASSRHSVAGFPASVTRIAQGASTALSEARRVVEKAGKRRPRTCYDGRYQETRCETGSDSDQSYLHYDRGVVVEGAGQEGEREEEGGCSALSTVESLRTNLHFGEDCLESEGKEDSASQDSGMHQDLDDSQVEVVKAVRKQLLQLQDLILTNSPDSAVDTSLELSSPENLVLLRSQLQQCTLLNDDLKEELSRFKNDCLQLQGIKTGLQQRLTEQDAMLSQLKSDKLNLEIELQTVTAENVSLVNELKDKVDLVKTELGWEIQTRDRTINSLQRVVMKRDQMIDKLQRELKHQAHDFHSSQHPQSPSPCDKTQDWQQVGAEMSFLQDSLHGVQRLLSSSSLPGEDPPPLDQLEKSIIGLLQNLRVSRLPGHPDASTSVLHGEPLNVRMFPDNESVRLRPGVVRSSHTGMPGVRGQGRGGPSTSVVFFADRSIQPTVCVMPGRLGQITLKDFKKLFEDNHRYRYYFKALDQDYGAVKEELRQDDAVVPGWEDRIVAWLEPE